MKLTKSKLKQIIKEEIENVMNEEITDIGPFKRFFRMKSKDAVSMIRAYLDWVNANDADDLLSCPQPKDNIDRYKQCGQNKVNGFKEWSRKFDQAAAKVTDSGQRKELKRLSSVTREAAEDLKTEMRYALMRITTAKEKEDYAEFLRRKEARRKRESEETLAALRQMDKDKADQERPKRDRDHLLSRH